MSYNRITIILFIPSLGRGGAERVFLNLANEWSKKYFVVLLFQYQDHFFYESLCKDIKSVKISRNFIVAAYQFCIQIIKYKPLFVLSCLNIPNIINAIISKIFFLKHKVVLRQASPLKIGKTRMLIKILLRISFRAADFIICNSKSTQKSLEKFSPGVNSCVISNPVINTSIDFFSNDYSEFNSILENKNYILAVGRLESVKNFTFLIRAFSEIKQTSLKLVILGEGSERKKLLQLVDELELNDKIYLLGAVKNPYIYYKRALLFVSTSLWEGFGNVFIEAAYFSLPIIATKSGSSQEILDNGNFGYLVESNNQIQLKDVMNSVLNNLDCAKRIPKDSLFRYNVSNVTLQYENFILQNLVV